MTTLQSQEKQIRLNCPGLPLAVYREIAAHLQQVDGVSVVLLPQRSPEFDYGLSQVGGVEITYPEGADEACYARVEAILAYYGDRFGGWERLEDG